MEKHKTTFRIIEILRLISENPKGFTLTELSKSTNSPKSSLYPILKTLSEEGLLFYDEKALTYHIGYASFEIGSAYLESFDILEIIKNSMTNIVNICLETCHLAVLVEGDVLYLEKVDSPESIRMMSTIGKRLPAYGTGLGKALLMDHTKKDLISLYPDGLKKLAPHTITNIDDLYSNIFESRTEGIAYECEESNEHVRCIAIPLRKDGEIVAALSVAVPTFRYDNDKEILIKELLKAEKIKIEKILQNSSTNFENFT